MENINQNFVPIELSSYMFKKGDKEIKVSERCHKFNRDETTEERIAVLTDQAFYLISSKKIHSKMLIKSLHYIIKSMYQGSNEVILCFKNEAGTSQFIDVRLNLDQRENFLKTLKEQYSVINNYKDLMYKVYGMPEQSLKYYRIQTKYEYIPDQKYRLA